MSEVDLPDLVYALVGIGALLAGILPPLLEGKPLSMPIAFLLLGVLVFALPLGLPAPDPLREVDIAEHLTEIGVIVALMGAGLKLDRPIGWRRWSATWRLLVIAMPVTIAATAFLSWWWMGLAPAAAVLLGSALAPTDPVLASDVQVGEPTDDEESEDDVRFTLTSEAGLNDALAFPFVYAAIAMATSGSDPSGWIAHWVTVDLLYKIGIGLIGGLVIGWLLGRLFFRPRWERLRLANHAEGFVALAATFVAYGVTELAQGYGFLAVFTCACTIRAAERSHEYHQVLHDFAEQTERLLTVLLLLLLGGAVATGMLASLTWPAVAVGVVLLLAVRPVVAWLSMVGERVRPADRRVIAFFGIRGIGSFYYLAYAAAAAGFADMEVIWATVAFVVIGSVVVHGVLATPVMQRVDRLRERPTAAS
jgi:NhaP-type Na+/H+ or K+/H+ antiporter